ncbi:MAG TPA: hypothetical protein VE783_12240 [Candidatus Limnocylindrales bacterium]|nr:hypothetical protein [Candidatus Limnocylindrales bacterium]
MPQSAYETELNPAEAAELPPGASAAPVSARVRALAAGQDFLQQALTRYSGRFLCGMPGGVLFLANTLSRINEIPGSLLSGELQVRTHELLDCLSEIGRMDGGWGREASPDWSDCLATCWVITALEGSGSPVPDESYAFVRACQRWDGSFAASPATKQHRADSETALATTVTAVRVLREISPKTEEYLLQALPNAECLAIASYICAEVLDWPAGLASWQLLNNVSRFTGELSPHSPAQLSTLLRCLVRLRLQRSWPVAAQLRAQQQPNGSWTGPTACLGPVSQHAEPSILTAALSSASAISSLLIADAQPGLYFGSDVPARRFNQGWRR